MPPRAVASEGEGCGGRFRLEGAVSRRGARRGVGRGGPHASCGPVRVHSEPHPGAVSRTEPQDAVRVARLSCRPTPE